MKKLCVLAILAAQTLITGPSFGSAALAIDGNQGSRYGWAVNYGTQTAADNAASQQCGETCSVVLQFSHECGAYAADQINGSSVYGWATNQNIAWAQSNALEICRSRGGQQCIVRAYGCDR